MLRALQVPVRRFSLGHRFSSVLVDGFPQPPLVSVHDLTFIRGDGAFEVVSLLPAPSNGAIGMPIGMSLHLDRLESTCRSLRLAMPHSAERIAEWVSHSARVNGPGSCRIIQTRGQPTKDVPPQLWILHDPPSAAAASLSLKSMKAPWHIGYTEPLSDPPAYSDKLDVDSWKTVKWMSYAPNCLVTRMAQEHGAEDALLIAADGRVLDGPNFAVGFVIGGALRLVDAASNRMLPSCTQMLAVLAAKSAGLPVQEGCVHIDEVRNASAGFAMSATRHITPLSSVDGVTFDMQNSFLCDLQAAYWRLANEELMAQDPAAHAQQAMATMGPV
eukprot:TRINITY_DN95229_c0_g1_i1.p1 TRINITY_DN95229_c0_g1~~TRINITY_DN95229_c0_g1_i1.p1  ORF type:complete len:329 (+),score=58.33 TRINITY_DN95229_c0_g1_i1:54-1040(+)